MSKSEDPRDASLESPFTLPPSWYKESYDGMSASGVMLSGLIMVTKNRFLAWPAVLLGLNGYVNQHSMRSKDGNTSALSNMFLVAVALVGSYLPLMMITKKAE